MKNEISFELNLKVKILRWCRARDFDGSQIPVTTRGFELRTSYMQCIYLIG